jgi:hypothetical protein
LVGLAPEPHVGLEYETLYEPQVLAGGTLCAVGVKLNVVVFTVPVVGLAARET